MAIKEIKTDEHLRSAGECFMFLSWVESTMRDFIVLHEGGEQMRVGYNAAYGNTSHPSDFAQKRLELSCLSFGKIRDRFYCNWPKLTNVHDTKEAIERVVIYRNGLAHAQIQVFRNYLLYVPNKHSLQAIREFCKCALCYQYIKNCECDHTDRAEPLTLKFSCLDKQFLSQLYGDISTVDVKCFLPIARHLKVAYQGVAWPMKKGHFFW